MELAVVRTTGGHRLSGAGPITEIANAYLDHLHARAFSSATVRGYAFDLLNFSRFLEERGASMDDVVPTDLFDYLDWQMRPRSTRGAQVVRLDDRRGAAPATVNRRIAAVRGLFEFAVISGLREKNPVPAPRRTTGLRARPQGLLGHVGTRRPRRGGRLVRQPRRLPESLEPAEVASFIGDLGTHRDRAMALAMLLGGLRSAEVRSLLLADVDMGMRQVKVTGKGSRQRVVPIDGVFFSECVAYLRTERPSGLATRECFVVLRGPTTGNPLTEAGLRRIFRTHRARSGATRVRPHRLRHTFGTEMAAAGIDLLALRELMGHASPETTAAYVHLSPSALAAEYARVRGATR
ncbi:MAG: tyrosine-type recombinase/integrase [Acidimicrobiales bacterium]|jgi:site-specific recombinase XerD